MKRLRYQSTKEVDLSRKLAVVLENMPYGLVMYLIQHFSNTIAGNDRYSNDDILYEISTEKTFNISDRYDVFIPLSYDNRYDEVIIETKLGNIGAKEVAQMERYLKHRNDNRPLVIGIGKSKSHYSNNIALSTWDELFNLLFNMLGYDSKSRLLQDDDLINKLNAIIVPKLNIGPINEVIVEQFLRDIIQKELLTIPISNRVLVVSGKFASNSCINYNIDLIGNRWDHSFKFLCVVYRKKLKYVGKKVKLYDDIQIIENEIVNQSDYDMDYNEKSTIMKLIRENAKRTNSNEIRGSAVMLEPVDLKNDIIWKGYNLEIDENYRGTGAITQSHRYFKDVESFINHFRQL